VLRTSGTNCDFEAQYALETAGAIAERLHVSEIIASPDKLDAYSILILPGGFSYGDDIAAGRVHANEIHFLLRGALDAYIEKGGLLMGICNGFQVLVKLGLLPYRVASPDMQQFSLVDNACGRFECRWVKLHARPGRCAFVQEDEVLEFPVAHGEGRFVAVDQKMIDSLFDKNHVVFTYCGEGSSEPEYPANPNGSYRSVAGVCDETGRILGMMPHPERHISPYSHPRHTREGIKKEGDGLKLFRNAVAFANRNRK
jgi:phosphoribosylformylglycinamidine synthase subunit PurQ / glutaminase